jgi:hypothetical protein
MHMGKLLARRPSASMVVALMALFFALVGGAYAANHYLITSKKQISPKMLKLLKGNVGPRGLTGLTGPAGAQGPQGTQGPKGDVGPAGPFPDTFPSGKTIRGRYWVGGTAAAGSGLALGNDISFIWPFSAAPTPHYIPSGGAVPSGCSGTAASPSASPGNLCVFEDSAVNAAARSDNNINGPSGDGTTTTLGAQLWVRSAAAGDFWIRGAWAATAP